MGYYGDRGDEELNEDSSPGTGFLAEVTHAWEAATAPAAAAGIRTVLIRSGLVLAAEGERTSRRRMARLPKGSLCVQEIQLLIHLVQL